VSLRTGSSSARAWVQPRTEVYGAQLSTLPQSTEAAAPPFFEAVAVEPDHLGIEITTEPDCTRVTLRGELDLGSVPDFEIETAPLHEGPDAPSAVVLDLGRLTFCDSAGLRALLMVTRALEQRDARVRLVNVPLPIRRVIEITGTATIFHIDQD
jgi:anti-anti-sigma factor